MQHCKILKGRERDEKKETAELGRTSTAINPNEYS